MAKNIQFGEQLRRNAVTQLAISTDGTVLLRSAAHEFVESLRSYRWPTQYLAAMNLMAKGYRQKEFMSHVNDIICYEDMI